MSRGLQIVIVGTGGQAREIHALLEALADQDHSYELVGFLDDDAAKTGEVHGVPVLGGVGWLSDRTGMAVAVGVGVTPTRRRVVDRIETLGDHVFPVLVHPSASVGPRVDLGEGTIVGAGAVLTTDIQVGRHTLLNFGCTVGHDVAIEDFATVAPGAHLSGAVRIEEGADIGTGASIIQGLTIGAWSVAGTSRSSACRPL